MRKNSLIDVFDRAICHPGKCWIWQRNTAPNGYGLMRYEGKYLGAHRVAWMAVKGEIPKNREIDHLCVVKNCINPDHMELVTPSENIRRAFQRNPHCKNGHDKPLGESNCAQCRDGKMLRSRPRRTKYMKRYNALPKAVAARKKWLSQNTAHVKDYQHRYYLLKKTKQEVQNAPRTTN